MMAEKNHRDNSIHAPPAALVLLGLWLCGCGPAGGQDWSGTLDRVAPAVVAVQVELTRPFEGQRPQSTQGTGFVVDGVAGLILTNRHIVTTGPVVARAIFVNGESVELEAVYRDPVHDFGFFRFEPGQLRFLAPKELPLAPAAARVGTEVRVVGNDAGERLSILAGTLSRLDRPAPNYQRLSYNDFNTFYIQAATGASGGSSGSPVIDVRGRVVALASGARSDAQTSFFLPLERAVDALAALRKGRAIPRGSIGTTFLPRPFHELRDLGLPGAVEDRARRAHPDAGGLLVVHRLLRGTPAAERLRLGDILLRVDGQSIAAFVPLERQLDRSVGESVELTVLRRGETRKVTVPVADLHAMTPSAFVDIGGTTLHDVSYQLARNLDLPLRGFQVTLPGFLLAGSGIDQGAVIRSVNGREFASLGALTRWLSRQPEGGDLRVRFRAQEQPRQERQTVVRIHREWFPERFCARDVLGPWRCRPLEPPAGRSPAPEPEMAFTVDPPIVHVEFRAPFGVAGYNELRSTATGLVVDAERGWVAVDREQVPHPMGEVRIVFASRFEVPAQVRHVHPVHALTILEYEPGSVPGLELSAPVFAAAEAGDDVAILTSGPDQQLSRRAATVVGRSQPRPGAFRHLRFTETNLDALVLPESPGAEHGILLDSSGAVVGLLSGSIAIDNQRGALPAELVGDLLRELRSGSPVPVLPAELQAIPLSRARRSGLGSELAEELVEVQRGAPPRVLQVVRPVTTESPGGLASGDLLLRIDDRPVRSFAELRERTTAPTVRAEVLRNGRIEHLDLALERLATGGVDRVIHWAGAMLHAPHRAARLAGAPPRGVYVASYFYGSPAQRHDLSPLHLVVAVDGEPVGGMDDFVLAVADLADRSTTVLELESWNGGRRVITLRTDLTHWPAFEIHHCPGGPRRSPLGVAVPCPPGSG